MMDGRHEKEAKAGCGGKKTFARAGHWSDVEHTKKQNSPCAAASTAEVKEDPFVTHASLTRVPASVSSGCYNKMPFTELYKQN